jgi:hypothetical protein
MRWPRKHAIDQAAEQPIRVLGHCERRVACIPYERNVADFGALKIGTNLDRQLCLDSAAKGLVPLFPA